MSRSSKLYATGLKKKKQVKAKPLICGNLYCQSQGSHLQLMNKGPGYTD